MAGPYRSAQKLRRDNALSEITSNATLKAAALANLGIAASGANLDGTFAIENTTDTTKKINFLASGNTTGITQTIASSATTAKTVTLPNATDTLVGKATTDTFTNKTYDTAGAGNSFLINGVAATANTGTGSVVRATTPTIVTPVISTGLTASGSAANDFSASTGTFKTSTGLVTIGGSATLPAGQAGAGLAPLYFTSGTNLTSAAAGALEYDGTTFYLTGDTTSGRGIIPEEQFFQLTADGSTISTIANFYGTNSNLSLVSSGYYDIECFMWFVNSADTNTVNWTLTNSAAPTSQNIYFSMSPLAGLVAPPGTATELDGEFLNDNTAAKSWASGALASAGSYYSYMRIWLKNSTGTSLKFQMTKNTGGTITPKAGSYWRATRLPATNVGNFAA